MMKPTKYARGSAGADFGECAVATSTQVRLREDDEPTDEPDELSAQAVGRGIGRHVISWEVEQRLRLREVFLASILQPDPSHMLAAV